MGKLAFPASLWLSDLAHKQVRFVAGKCFPSADSRLANPSHGKGKMTMRELSTNDLDTVNGGTVLTYPGVYIQEMPGNVTPIPGVSTSTGQYSHVYRTEKIIRRF
jgi:hypothetical protein